MASLRSLNYCTLDQILENVYYSNEEMAKKLLYRSKDKPTNITDRLGNTLVHTAVNNNDENKLSMFIKLKCDVNLANKFGEYPLHIAIKNNAFQLISILLNAGATVSNMCIPHDFPSIKKADIMSSQIELKPLNCLQLAVLLSNYDVIELVAEKAHTLDITNALNIAISLGHEKVIKLLITKGANLEKPNTQGMTPLLNAIAQNNYSLTTYILKRMSSCMSCKASFSPLSASVCLSKKSPYQATQIWPVLLNYGMDPNFLCCSSELNNFLQVIEIVNGKLFLQKLMGFCLFPSCIIFTFKKEFLYSKATCLKLLIRNNCQLIWNPGEHSIGTTRNKMHDSVLPHILASDNTEEMLSIIFNAGFDVTKLSSESRNYLEKFTLCGTRPSTQMLYFHLRNPLGLKKLCRNVVRHVFRTDIKTKIKLLNLPKSLEKYILIF